MRKIIFAGIIIFFAFINSVTAEEAYTLKSPSGLITIEDPNFVKMYNIPVSLKNNETQEEKDKKDEFLKRQQEFLENTHLQRLYMDEFYFMRAPYQNFYRYYQ